MRGMGKPSPLKQIHGKDGNSYGKGNDMTHIFKPGDKAMVEIVGGQGGQGLETAYYIACAPGRLIPIAALSPLPAVLTPEAQAVMDGVLKMASSGWDGVVPDGLLIAIRAYRASLTPPDPVAEVIAAWNDADDYTDIPRRLSLALLALEASRKP